MTAYGAYGLRLRNVDDARSLLVDAPVSWTELRIESRVGRGPAGPELLGESEAVLRLRDDGAILVDRLAGEATFVLPEPLRAAELVHPLLAPVGAVVAYWTGRESFHAGAFVVDGRAWGIVGPRGTGKSTTMAQLALDGADVLTDDLLVLDGTTALAGPRSVDLRRAPAEALGVGEPLGVVGVRERWRLTLEPIAATAELAGWVFLAWGEEVECVRVPAHERIRRLQGERGLRVPPRDPARLVELAALPTWELRRPRRLESLAEAAACLQATAR